MKITLIAPPLLLQKGDLFGSGVPFLPVETAIFAGFLRQRGVDVKVVDCFGEKPRQMTGFGKFALAGLSETETLALIDKDSDFVGIMTSTAVYSTVPFAFVSSLALKIKSGFKAKLFFSGIVPTSEPKPFLDAGADFVVLGDPEAVFEKISLKKIGSGPGIAFKHGNKVHSEQAVCRMADLDAVPFPAWDLFPLENYWRLGFAHGPVHGKYLPILSSRGCPFNCGFCVVPAVWKNRWAARSAKNVVDELAHWNEKLGVADFHFEDFNPTVDKGRMKEISREIISRKLEISWKLVSGTKVETLDEETLEIMAKAGCDYISISPETGSKAVLGLMGKPFDYAYAEKMLKKMSALGISAQACFVIGYPGEGDSDRALSVEYAKKLAKVGVDEIAVFIMAPLPGARVSKQKWDYSSYEQLTFSPAWRADFGALASARMRMYMEFLLHKSLWHPMRVLSMLWNALRGQYSTKMEMAAGKFLRSL